MSVRRRDDRDNAYWIDVVEWVDGKRVRVRERAPIQNKREAERYAHEVRQRLREKSYEPVVKREAPTFEAFAENLKTYARTNNKPSELASKEAILRLHLVPFFGKMPIDRIGSKQIEAYKAAKLHPTDADSAALSPKTVNNHLTVLRKTLALAKKYGELAAVPDVEWLHVPEQKFDFLTFDEADRMIAAADPEWRCMVVIALRCGLRQGELIALGWDDVDLVAGRIRIRRSLVRGKLTDPKGKRSRDVDLSDQALDALKAQRARTQLRGEWVFSGEGGRMLTKGECKWPLWSGCKRAGLRRIGWHVARHTFASHLVMRGAPLKSVQELMGHRDIKQTMRYAHLSPDVRRDAVKLLDRRGTSGAPSDQALASNQN